MRRLLPAAALLILAGSVCHAQQPLPLSKQLSQLQAKLLVPLNTWRFHQPDISGGERPSYNASSWPKVQTGYQWQGDHSKVWFRKTIVLPAEISGIPTAGQPLRLDAGVDDAGEIYVNGMQQQTFSWNDGTMVLTRQAVPGRKYVIAIRGINITGPGQLHFVYLGLSLPQLDQLQQETAFFEELEPNEPVQKAMEISAALQQCATRLDLPTLHDITSAQFEKRLAYARQPLLALKGLAKGYEVDYVGHAHIDMNWLWPWSDTIDTCKRTWRSVLHLMKLFPDFCFVQSQPGAYAAIQKRYPAEVAAMEAAQKRGQWEVVGGLWNESDTNLPTGEALARSFLLGQRYFKKNFGTYAVTGWLPDSFGHSWQLPQLMRLAGINSFYHMRCGDGVRLAWWESPDGSKVLKANTDSYDEPIQIDQLVRPWHNQKKYDVKRALVVFGVGDHGGGPTRQQILTGKGYQADPLLPKIRFCTAKTFFNLLRKEPAVKSLPVVDTDLQYTFTGCYTTHADLKTAVRRNENQLYSSEVYSSLASTVGLKYPAKAFRTAWKPTAFAQFHDIMCGSAIHSTYIWMRNRLRPADVWARKQQNTALQVLTEHTSTVGTRGGEQPVVVWNALSTQRTDVATVSVPDAGKYHSVRDSSGSRFPVQLKDNHTVVFVAENVPGFGKKVYWLSPLSPTIHPTLVVKTIGNTIVLRNGYLKAVVNRTDGLLNSLTDMRTGRQVLQPGKPQNVFELLGDQGNAWDINYTGKNTLLIDQGAKVRLLSNGPVYAVVEVVHSLGASVYRQYITLYQNVDRLDIPCIVDWHEHAQMLKVDFTYNMANPALHVSIPYGSINRPDNGQENPGQSWMNMTDYTKAVVTHAHMVQLRSFFNSDSSKDFDGQGRTYVRSLFPTQGLHHLGAQRIPVWLHGSEPGDDNVACNGQDVPLAGATSGQWLYALGAGAMGTQSGSVTFVMSTGQHIVKQLLLADWVTGGSASDETWMHFPYHLEADGSHSQPTQIYGTRVQLPTKGTVVSVILPVNPQMHIFGAALANVTPGHPIYGVTVLNNCKNGNDADGARFRLSLLRSTSSPDPTPDFGKEVFTYSLTTNTGNWQNANLEAAGKSINVPLTAVVTGTHRGGATPATIALKSTFNDVEAGALKHDESGRGLVLRIFETRGRNTTVTLHFPRRVTVQPVDILERPMPGTHPLTGRVITMHVGHDKIVSLHITGLHAARL